MTERDPGPSDRGPSGPDTGPRATLQDLKARLTGIRSRQAARTARQTGRADMSGAGVAVRVGIELAGTLAVGVGIGWLLDRWLGTGPWFLVVFFFLGAAGGVLNVYRAVAQIGLVPGYRYPADEEPAEEGSAGGTAQKNEDDDTGGTGRPR